MHSIAMAEAIGRMISMVCGRIGATASRHIIRSSNLPISELTGAFAGGMAGRLAGSAVSTAIVTLAMGDFFGLAYTGVSTAGALMHALTHGVSEMLHHTASISDVWQDVASTLQTPEAVTFLNVLGLMYPLILPAGGRWNNRIASRFAIPEKTRVGTDSAITLQFRQAPFPAAQLDESAPQPSNKLRGAGHDPPCRRHQPVLDRRGASRARQRVRKRSAC